MYQIQIHIGNNFIPYIDIISQLRIEIFKEYPYLYKGDLDYEKKYMQGYLTDHQAMIALASINERIVGISTGIPLISDSEIVMDAKKVFAKDNIDISDYYYYGEMIILPEHRRKGLATQLCCAQNKVIKRWGFKHVCILTVVRGEDHPLKPTNYISQESLWKSLGFSKNNLTINYSWPTIQVDQSATSQSNTLEFWTTHLSDEF